MSLLGLLDEKRNPPVPPTESFAGRTILVTGATGGLGLEAAKSLVGLHVETLIITARNESKGQIAKKEIDAAVRTDTNKGPGNSTKVIPMVLDMSSFDGVKTFVDTLQAQFPRIDGAILNAGTLQQKYVQSKDGWEETIQVNALGSFLLGVLLLPLLAAAADSGARTYKPHLTFVSSGTAWMVKPAQMTNFMASESPLEDLSAQKSFPTGTMGGANQYGRSKLLLEYAVRHLATSPALKGADGQPKVIVNTTCPGMCKSDLGRQMTGNPLLKLLAWVMYTIVARTAEQGANSYLRALTLGDDSHGEMWKTDRIFETGPMVSTEEGQKFGDRIWSEFLQVVVKADPSTKAYVS